MPPTIVTLSPRADLLGRKAAATKRVLAALRERYGVRDDGRWLEIEFPDDVAAGDAKSRVVADLDEIDPRWRRLFRIYPRG